MKEKLMSGRFLLTVICGMVFAYTAIFKIMPVDKVTEIILIVIYAYFTKQNNTPTGGTKNV